MHQFRFESVRVKEIESNRGIEKWNRSESVGSKKESNWNRNFGEPESKKLEPNLSSILALVSFYELLETYEEKESQTHSILSIRFLRFRISEVSIPVGFFFRSHRFGSIPLFDYTVRFDSDPGTAIRFDQNRNWCTPSGVIRITCEKNRRISVISQPILIGQ